MFRSFGCCVAIKKSGGVAGVWTVGVGLLLAQPAIKEAAAIKMMVFFMRKLCNTIESTWGLRLIKLTVILAAALISLSAFAQAPAVPGAAASCEAKAADKKLAGAAKSSFVKKCEKDSGAPAASAAQVCESKAAEKKLAGAAKNSFVKKCEKDAAGG